MTTANPYNVFKGPDSLNQYYDPDQNPPLPLVEIPENLNPMRKDGVRIYAKMLTALPAHNVKSLPVLNMLQQEPDLRGKPLVEASSGSTVLSIGIIARALWGHDDVHAHVSNKKPVSQMNLMRLFGIHVDLFGGNTQPTYDDPKGIMGRLKNRAAQIGDVHNLAQYHNEHNWKSHIRWTGPQIVMQLPEINVFCAAVGTGGCIVGTGKYMKSKKPSITVVGVFNAHNDTTPGPRHFAGMDSAPFAEGIFGTIDSCEIVKSVDSFRTSMMLCRNGIICGPSSGQSLHGLLEYLQKQKAADRLNELADPITGEISCVFICADLPYPYVDLYHTKLSEDEFPKIYNKELLTCDLDTYDDRFHLTPPLLIELLDRGSLASSLFCQRVSSCGEPQQYASSPGSPESDSTSSSVSRRSSSCSQLSALSSLSGSSLGQPTTVIDFRSDLEFSLNHLYQSIHLPLPDRSDDLFANAKEVQQRWEELKELFEEQDWLFTRGSHIPTNESDCATSKLAPKILLVCTHGDTSRMATAMLRARGIQAYCVKGGFQSFVSYFDESDISV